MIHFLCPQPCCPKLDIMPTLKTFRFSFVLSATGAVIAIALSLWLSPTPIPLFDTFHEDSPWSVIFWDIRIPRVLGGFFVGALLAASGVIIQGLFRNPLAEPGVIGISSGAALGAACALFFQLSVIWLPVSACIGAGAATLLLLWAGRHLMGHDMSQFILIGVALNFTTSAFIGLMTYLSSDSVMRSIAFWSLGNLSAIHHEELVILASVTLLSSLCIWRYLASLNIWLLGADTSLQLGVNTQQLTRIMVLFISIMVGIAVAFCGVIGFIGLLIPHAVRFFVGVDVKRVLPLSMLWGGAALVLSDWLSQSILPPAQLPLSMILAMAGGPLFIALLYRVQRKGWG